MQISTWLWSWLESRRHRHTPQSPLDYAARLTLRKLEERQVLNVSVAFDGGTGTLALSTTTNDAVVVTVDNGTHDVFVNGDNTGIQASAVHELQITATGNFDNTIDLTGVTSTDFTQSGFGVSVHAGDGNDVISMGYADHFTIDGEAGNDIIHVDSGLSLDQASFLTAETIDIGAVVISTNAGSLTFDGTTSLTSSTLTGEFYFNGNTHLDTSSISGDIHLGGDLFADAGANTINGQLNLGGPTHTFTVDDPATLVINADIGDTDSVAGAGIIKDGNGVLTLAGTNNTYTGVTEIAAGTLALSDSSSHNNIATSSEILIDSTGFIDVSGLDSQTFVLDPGQTFTTLSAYVDDDWAGGVYASGTYVANVDGLGHSGIFGLTAFGSIQNAVDAVSDGGFVEINDGTYGEAVTIDKSLTLDGLSNDAANVIISAGLVADGISITSGATDVKVSDLTVDGSIDGIHAVSVSGTLQISNVITTNNASHGIELQNIGTIEISDVVSEDNGGDGINITTVMGDLTLDNVTAGTASHGNAGNGITINELYGTGTLTNVTADSNALDGITLINVASGGTVAITGGGAHGNGQNGVSAFLVDDLTIDSADYSSNSNHGLNLNNINALQLTDVTADSNTGNGLEGGGITSVTVLRGSFSSNTNLGIDLYSVDEVTLTNVTASDNQAGGVWVLGGGTSITVSGGVFDTNHSTHGLLLFAETVSVSDAEVKGNDFYGIAIGDATTVTIENTVTSNNGYSGVLLSSCGDVTFTDLTASGNALGGVVVSSANSVSFINGSITDNTGGAGIEIDGVATSVTLNNTTVTGNSGDGLLILPNDAVPLPGADTVVITGGTYSGNQGDGIHIEGVTTSIEIDSADIENNTNYGFEISDSSAAAVTLSNLTLLINGTGGSVTDVASLTFNTTTGDDIVDVNAGGSATLQQTTNAVVQQAISYSNVNTLNVNTLGGDDTVNVTPDSTTDINLDGGIGNDTVTIVSASSTIAASGSGFTVTTAGNNSIYAQNFENVEFSGAVVFGGTTGDDTLELTEISSTSASYNLYADGILVASGTLSNVTSIEFDGGDGDDLFVINNLSGAVFAPTGGIIFDGGTAGENVGGVNPAGDTLQIIGGTTNSVDHQINDTNGSVVYDGATAITYTGVSSILDTIVASTRTFTFLSGAEVITVKDSGTVGESQIGTSSEQVVFANPTSLLTVDAGDGADTISFDGVGSGFAASLVIHGGDGDDIVNLNGVVQFASSTTVSVDAETINVNNGADLGFGGTSDGAISLTASKLITLSGSLTANDVSLVTDSIDIASTAAITGTTVEIHQFTNSTEIDLGSTLDPTGGPLSLSDTELHQITAGTLTIGDANSGSITVSDDVAPANVTTLQLITNAAVVDAGGAVLTVANLAIEAVSGIGDSQALELVVGTLAFQNTMSGNVDIHNTGAITVGAVGVLDGSTGKEVGNFGGGTLQLSAASPITIAIDMTSVGSATITAGETSDAPTFADNLTIDAGYTVSVTGAAANLTLQAGDDVVINGNVSSASGDVVVAAGFGDLDGSGAIAIAGHVTAANLISMSAETGITDAAGAQLSALQLELTGSGDVVLTQDNEIGAIAANLAGSLTYVSANTFTVGSAGATPGITLTSGGTLDLTANTGVIELDADITTAGTQTYQSDVELLTSVNLNSGSGDIDFVNKLDGTYSLHIIGGNDVTFSGAVGSNAGLESLGITVVGTVTISDSMQLGEDGNQQGYLDVTAQNFVLNGSIDTQDADLFGGAVIINASAITLGGSITTDVGGVTLNGDVVVAATTTIQTGEGSVVFYGNIDGLAGGESLTVTTAGSGVIQVDGYVGAISAVGDLHFESTGGAGRIYISHSIASSGNVTLTSDIVAVVGDIDTTQALIGGDVSITGTLRTSLSGDIMTDAGNVILDSHTVLENTIHISSNSGDITINGTLDSSDLGGPTVDGLFLQTVSGTVFLNAEIGPGDVDVGGDDDGLAFLDVIGATQISGNVTTYGFQTYHDAVELANNVILTSTGAGDITFNDAINGTHSLEIDTAGATNIGNDVGMNNALTSLTTDSAGTTVIAASQISAGSVTFNDAVQVKADVEIIAGAITFGGTLDESAVGGSTSNVTLTINTAGGDILFTGAVGDTIALDSLTITSADDVTFTSTVETVGNLEQDAGTGTTTLHGTGPSGIGGQLLITTDNIHLATSGVTTTGNVVLNAAEAITVDAGLNAGASTIAIHANTADTGLAGFDQTAGIIQTTNGTTSAISITVGGSGDALLNDLRAATTTGTVVVSVADGAIADNSASNANLITAGYAALTAAKGIGSTSDAIETAVSHLAFHNTTSGNVSIINTGGLTIDDVGVVHTSSNDAAAGTVTLVADSPITFAVDTTSGGTILATATDDSANDDITVNAAVTVKSTGGDVIFQAGDNISLAATSVLKSDTGNVTLISGYLDSGDGGAQQLDGSVQAANTVTIDLSNVAGSANEGSTGSIVAPNLQLLSTANGSSFVLTSATNNVDILAAAVSGSIKYQDLNGVDIGTVTTVGIVTSNDDVTIQSGGAVGINNSISVGVGTVRIAAGGDVTERPGATVSAAALGVTTSVGSIVFDQSNTVGTFAAADTDLNGAVTIVNSTNLTIGSVAQDGTLFAQTDGITTNAGAVTISASGFVKLSDSISATGAIVRISAAGDVTEDPGATISAASLGVRTTSGDVVLTQANDVATFAAKNTDPSGVIKFRDANSFNVGSVVGTGLFTTTTGIGSNNGDVTLKAGTTLGINESIDAGTATVRLAAGGSISEASGKIITADKLGVTTSAGNITLTELNQIHTFAADDSGGTGSVKVVTAGGVDVNTVAADSNVSLFAGASGVTTANGDFTLNAAGAILISQAIQAGAGTVRLQTSTGGVSQASAGTITADKLGVQNAGNGNVTLDKNNNVATVAIQNTVGGATVTYNDIDGVTVGSVIDDGLLFTATDGISTTAGDVTLTTGGLLTIGDGTGQDITAAGATVTLSTSSGGISESVGSIVSAASLLLLGTGNDSLTEANSVGKLAADVDGTIAFVNAGTLSIGTVAGTDGIQTTNDSVTVTTSTGDLKLDQAIWAGTGAVTLEATLGSILDDSDGSTMITAGDLSLTAKTNIGDITSWSAGTGNAIDATITGSLTKAAITDAGGEVFIHFTGNATIGVGALNLGSGVAASAMLTATGNLDAGNVSSALALSAGDQLALEAGGKLTLPDGGLDVGDTGNLRLHGANDVVDTSGRDLGPLRASNLDFASGSAGGNTVLNTRVSTITALVSGASANGKALTINEYDGLTLTSISTTNGDVTVNASQTLGGNITVLDVNAGTARASLDTTANGGGQIIDGDSVDSATTADITANEIDLRAATGIGNGNKLEVAAASLAATTVGGDISIRDVSGNLSIANLASGTNGVSITGGVAGNKIEISTMGSLSVDADVTNAGTGNRSILLAADGTAATNDLSINANVKTMGGDSSITLLAGDTVSFAGTSTVYAAGAGAVDVLAGTAFNNGAPQSAGATTGNITMMDGSVIKSDDGNITLSAPNDVAISIVNANANNDATLGNIFITADADSSNVGAISETLTGEGANLIGGTATLHAATGIGAGDDLDTDLHDVSAVNTTSNAIAIQEVAAGGDLILTGATNVGAAINVSTIDGHLTVSGAVSTTTSGTIDLFAGDSAANGGGNLVLQSTISTGSGQVTLTSERNDVTFTAAADVTTATGTIQVKAGTATGGKILMTDDNTNVTVLDAGSGLIDLQAGGDVQLGKVITTSSSNIAVQIHSTAGAVIDADTNGAVDVDAADGGLVIVAATGIGSGNAIETTVASIDVTNTTSGNVKFVDTNALSIQQVNQQASGTVDVTSNGAMTIATGGAGVSATSGKVTLSAVGAASTVDVNATISTTSGDVEVDAGSTLTVNHAISTGAGSGGVVSVSNATINAALSAGAGNITLNGGGQDLIINVDQTSATTITYSATRDIIIRATVTATGGTSDIKLTADSDGDHVGGVWIDESQPATNAKLDAGHDVILKGSDVFATGSSVDSIRIDNDGASNQIVAGHDISLIANAAAPANADIVIDGVMTATSGSISVDSAHKILISADQNAGASILFQDAVQLTGDIALTAGQDVTFQHELDGTHSLLVNANGTTTFDGAIGVGAALTSLTTNANGTTDLNGGVVNATTVDLKDDVELTANTVVNGTTVTFEKTLNADATANNRTLLVNATSTTFGGTIGNSGVLASLTTDATGTTYLNGATIQSTLVDFQDAVVLGTSVTITGTNVSFDSTVDGTAPGVQGLTVNASGTTTFGDGTGDDKVGGQVSLSFLTTDTTGTTILKSTSVTTSGDQTYHDVVQLASNNLTANTTLNAVNVSFDSTVDGTAIGTQGLTVNASGTTTFGDGTGDDKVGGLTSLSFLTTDANGKTIMKTTSVTTSGNQTYHDAIQLASNTVTANTTLNGANVSFDSTVDGTAVGTQGLTVNASGTTTFGDGTGDDKVGDATSLSFLTTDALGTTILKTTSVTTSGDQTYHDVVQLASNTVTANTTLNGVNVSFDSTVDGAAVGTQGLTVNASGTTTFGDGTGDDKVGGLVSLSFLTTDANGTTVLKSTSVTTSGDQTYHDAVQLASNTVMANTTLNGVNVSFDSTLDGTAVGTQGLTVNASGTTTFGDGTGDDKVGDLVSLSFLTTDATGTTVLKSTSVTTSGDQTYHDAVQLASNTITANTTLNGVNVSFNSTVDGTAVGTQGLTVNSSGTTTFGDGNGDDKVGDLVSLSFLTTDASGTTILKSTSITTAGDQTYHDVVKLASNTVTADTTLNGVNISFDNTVNGTAIGTQGLTVNASGTTTFGDGTGDDKVGGLVSLSFLTTDALGTTILMATSVTTSGDQTYHDAVKLASNTVTTDTTLNAVNVSFDSTLDGTAVGSQGLTVNASGTTTFGDGAGDDKVGDLISLSFLTTDATGTTVLKTTSVTASGDQTYHDVVELASNSVTATTTLNGVNVSFDKTVDGTAAGTQGLTVNASGTTTFGDGTGDDKVGGLFSLSFLTTDAAGTTVLKTTSVTTSGDQTYHDAVQLASNTVTANTTLNGVNVSFDSTVDGTTAGAQGLTVNASGTTTIGDGTGDDKVGGLFALSFLTTDATGTTVLKTTSVTTSGDQAYHDAVQLASNTVTANTTLNGVNVSFDSTLDGTAVGTQGLTVNASGTTTFGDGTGDDKVGDLVSLSFLTTDVVGTTVLKTTSVTTSGDQTYHDVVKLASNSVTANTTLNGVNVSFDSTVDGTAVGTQGLIVNASGTTTFGDGTGDDKVGGLVSLSFLTTDAVGTTILKTTSVTTSGDQTYHDQVTLASNSITAVTALNGHNITFDTTLNGTASGAQGLRIDATGNVLFTGVVGAVRLGDVVILNAVDVTESSGFNSTSLVQQAGTGTTTFNGAVTTTSSTGVQLTTNAITVNAPITTTGTGIVTLTNAGLLTINGDITADGAITQNGAGAVTITEPRTLTTTGDNVSFLRAVTLSGSAGLLTIDTTVGGNVAGADVTFSSTVHGATPGVNAESLAIDAGTGGQINFVGAVDSLKNMTITNSGNTTFQSSLQADTVLITDTAGTVAFQGNTTLSTLTTTNQPYNVTFGKVGGPAVTDSITDAVTFLNTGLVTIGLNAGDSVTFGNGVTHTAGATDITGTLTSIGGAVNLGTTSLNGIIRTQGQQVTVQATTLTGTSIINTTFGNAAGADITFGSTLDATTAGVEDLTLNAGTAGNILFTGAVGGSKQLGDLAITNAHNVTEQAGITATTLTQSAGTGTTTLNAAVNTSAAGGVALTTNVITVNAPITTTGAGVVTFTNAGLLTLNGDINSDGAVTQNGAGAVLVTPPVGGTRSITTTGDSVSFLRAVTMNAQGSAFSIDTTGSGNTAGGSVTFSSTLDATSVAPNAEKLLVNAGTGGDVLFTGAVGGIVRLGNVTISNAHNVTETGGIRSASLTQTTGTGLTTLNGAVDTNTSAGVDLTTGALTVNNTVTATDQILMKALNLNGNINLNSTLQTTQPTGSVSLTAVQGGITNGAAANVANVISNSLVMQTAHGIGSTGSTLLTKVATISAHNTGSGNIRVDNVSGQLLTISAVGGVNGITNDGAQLGNVAITNNGSILVSSFSSPTNAPITNSTGGSISLITRGGAFDITVNSPITASGGSGSITLNAGRNLVVNDTGVTNDISASGAGTVYLTAANSLVLGNQNPNTTPDSAQHTVPNDVVIQSGTGSVTNTLPLVYNIQAPQLGADGIVTISGDFGRPGEHNITVTIYWGDGTSTTQTFADAGHFSFSHTYHGNPNKDDQSAPILINVQVAHDPHIVLTAPNVNTGTESVPDGGVLNPPPVPTPNINADLSSAIYSPQDPNYAALHVPDTKIVTATGNVTNPGTVVFQDIRVLATAVPVPGEGLASFPFDVTPTVRFLNFPEQAPAIDIHEVSTLQLNQQDSLRLDLSGADEGIATERIVFLEILRADGSIEKIRLPETVLDDLMKTIADLPDGRYRFQLIEPGESRLRLLLDTFEVRQGKIVDENDAGERPPSSSMRPGKQAPILDDAPADAEEAIQNAHAAMETSWLSLDSSTVGASTSNANGVASSDGEAMWNGWSSMAARRAWKQAELVTNEMVAQSQSRDMSVEDDQAVAVADESAQANVGAVAIVGATMAAFGSKPANRIVKEATAQLGKAARLFRKYSNKPK